MSAGLHDLGSVPTSVLSAALAQHSDLARESVFAAHGLLGLGWSPVDLHPDDVGRLLGGLSDDRWVGRYYGPVMSADVVPVPSAGRRSAVCRVGWCTCADHDRLVPFRVGEAFPTWMLTPDRMATHLSGGRISRPAHIRLIGERFTMNAITPTATLLVVAPPQHSKSSTIGESGSLWQFAVGSRSFLDHDPTRLIFETYETTLAAMRGREVRNLIREHGSRLGLALSGDTTAKAEFALVDGSSMLAASSSGSVTGRSATTVIVDDAHKNAAEGASVAATETVWTSYRAVAATRLTATASVTVAGTRWSDRDLIGRIERNTTSVAIAATDGTEMLHLPALAEDADVDPLGRDEGDPLWPESKPVEFLESRANLLGPRLFSTLYQGRPYELSGDLFDRADWRFVDAAPDGLFLARYWDPSSGRSKDWTAGVLLGIGEDGATFVLDVVRFRKPPSDAERIILATAERDRERYGRGTVSTFVESEPGSGNWADSIVRLLAGHRVIAYKPRGHKVLGRATVLSAQHGAGRVAVVRTSGGDLPPWTDHLVDEAAALQADGSSPGENDDTIDALSTGYVAALEHLPRKHRMRIIDPNRVSA